MTVDIPASVNHTLSSAETSTSTSSTAVDNMADNMPWYAIRILRNRHKSVVAYLNEKHVEIFIPQQYVYYIDRNGQRRHELKPVVYNIVFVKKTMTTKEMHEIVSQSNLPFYVFRTVKGGRNYHEIPAHEMAEFQQMCNPDIAMRHYLSEQEARIKPGGKVIVTHGPLKGLTGRLVRISKKYFLLKEVPGIGIALKVSRWCCKAIE